MSGAQLRPCDDQLEATQVVASGHGAWLSNGFAATSTGESAFGKLRHDTCNIASAEF